MNYVPEVLATLIARTITKNRYDTIPIQMLLDINSKLKDLEDYHKLNSHIFAEVSRLVRQIDFTTVLETYYPEDLI